MRTVYLFLITLFVAVDAHSQQTGKTANTRTVMSITPKVASVDNETKNKIFQEIRKRRVQRRSDTMRAKRGIEMRNYNKRLRPEKA